MIFQTITKEDFNTLNIPSYEGYLWWSDKDSPECNPVDPIKLTDLPFVVEGMLYNAKEQISLRIQNLDGEYIISKVDFAEAAKADKTNLKIKTAWYPAFRMGKGQKLIFNEAYQLIEDPLNPGFQVWKPTWRAFAGFK